MQNLAGKADCDKAIRHELTRCGIPVVENNPRTGEVPASLVGQLGPFKFDRRWYYWACSGPVPLAVAEELYTELYKGDIRSGGDCGCREPKTWATAMNGDKIVVTPQETAKVDEFVSTSSIYADFAKNPAYQLCRDQAEYDKYPKFVDTFHIDSELGLYIFVQALKKHQLV